jgi:hypothetical protein
MIVNRVLIGAAAMGILALVAVSYSESGGQKQAAEPRIVAAGTAIWKLGNAQNNRTSVRVQLKHEFAAKIGTDYIVLLTPRYTGFPYYSAYWKKAKDGFEIYLVDPEIGSTGSRSYLFEVNRDYPVDWIVVKK